MAKFRLNLYGKEKDVEITRQGQRLHVVADGVTADLQLVQQDGPSFIIALLGKDGIHKQIHGAGHADGDRRQLWINGRTLTYQRVRQRGSSNVPDGSLSSSIPAVVSEILVKPGESVEAGDKLILLESMKMIIPIVAPTESRVMTIHCAAGESIQAGIPLIELAEIKK